jgi:glyoxylase-like metal-dependent hydrolase (beta-lactamase superfamily II)
MGEGGMQIAPGLHSLGDDSGGWVRSFLVEDGDGLLLIDTLSQEDGRMVLEELRAMGRSPTDIKRIILTHSHPSHLMGLAALKKLTGARVYSHDWEADIAAGKRKMVRSEQATILPRKPIKIYKFQLGFYFGIDKHAPCEVDDNLKDGDHVGPLVVMHVPGHTPGSLAFYWPERRALIAGDMVSTWPEPALGWPQITLDNKQNRESAGKLADMVNAEILCVGHGDPVVEGGAQVMKDLFHGKEVRPKLAAAV